MIRGEAFRSLKQAVIRRTGLAYWADKDRDLAGILEGVCREKHLSPGELAQSLECENGGGPVTDAVVAAVTVGETYFFRDRSQFSALASLVLPERLTANRALRSLSIWSAGCSIGAEAYSIAMTIRSAGFPLEWRLVVMGTDVDRRALAAARAGVFRDWALRDLSDRERQAFFTGSGNKWRVRDVYRRGVAFHFHNLVSDPAPVGPAEGGRFDIIFCRNVLMYFDAQTRAKVLAVLSDALVEGGWLALGHAEAGPDLPPRFRPLPGGEALLYRKGGAMAVPPPPRQSRRMRRGVSSAPLPVLRHDHSEADIRTLLNRGDVQQALHHAQLWAESAPMDPLPHFLLALAWEPVSAVRAVAELKRTLYLDGGNILAHFHLMRLLAGTADGDRHRDALMEALAGVPADAPIPHGEGLTVADLMAVARHMGAGKS